MHVQQALPGRDLKRVASTSPIHTKQHLQVREVSSHCSVPGTHNTHNRYAVCCCDHATMNQLLPQVHTNDNDFQPAGGHTPASTTLYARNPFRLLVKPQLTTVKVNSTRVQTSLAKCSMALTDWLFNAQCVLLLVCCNRPAEHLPATRTASTVTAAPN